MSPFSSPAPQDYGDWRDKLQRHIQDAPENHSFFWLIDPCVHGDLPGLMWQLDPQPDAWPLYMNTYLEEAVNSGPFMAPYRQNSQLSKWLLQELPLRPLACLIEIETTSARLVFEHLQNIVECLDADGKRSIFRFYDPRIAYAIGTYEHNIIVPHILGPVLRLHGWEPGRCAPVSLGMGKDTGLRCQEMARYEPAFFDHLWDEVQFHAIIGTLGREPGAVLRKMPLPEAYQLVQRTSVVLARFGYADRKSLSYGVSFSAWNGDSVWELVTVRQALEDRPPQAPLREVLESIDI